MMRRTFWTRDWVLGLLVTLVAGLGAASDLVQRLEWKAYDLGIRFALPRPPSPDVAILAIDDPALEALGPWPWPRDRLAAVVQRLHKAGAGAVGLVLPLDSAENATGVAAVRQLASETKGEQLRAVLTRLTERLETDRTLAGAFAKAGNVILALPSEEAFPAAPPDYLFRRSFADLQPPALPWIERLPGVLNLSIPEAPRLRAPIPELADAAAGVGHVIALAEASRGRRAEPLMIRWGDRFFPSLPLLMVVESMKLPGVELEADRQGVRLAGRPFPVDSALRVYPHYYQVESGRPFATHSVAELFAPESPRRLAGFRGKLVLVGPTAASLAALVDLPTGEAVPPVEALAHIVSSLQSNDLYTVPSWARPAQLAALAVVGLYLMLVLPRFRITSGLLLSLLLLFVALNVHFVLLIARSMWVPLAVPVVALLGGQAAFTLKRLLEERIGVFQSQLSRANRQLGQLYQSQGQLDRAFAHYQRCPMGEELLEQLYTLGLDYERKRQFNKAARVFEQIVGERRRFRDAAERVKRNREMERVVVLGKTTGSPNETLLMPAAGLQKPMLGRYQIESELGRGAMGLVYLGRDPKIGRTVAIKTMALSQEFEADQLDEVRARFYREAETAGRLNHPNIVTIYDVGEEQDLAYIAMDYLKGQSLSAYCKEEQRLPVDTVMEIGVKVAEALDYAHRNNIVHRDIKPANIIFDAETGSVKVTDFGVACLTDASKTRTGTILGSPSYMSPEQLAGQKLDGRSDLFSLGITLYQLLTCQLPFNGDSLTSLMYKITHERHPALLQQRPDLPPCLAKVIDKALQKQSERRFKSGEQMADALRRCREQAGGEA